MCTERAFQGHFSSRAFFPIALTFKNHFLRTDILKLKADHVLGWDIGELSICPVVRGSQRRPCRMQDEVVTQVLLLLFLPFLLLYKPKRILELVIWFFRRLFMIAIYIKFLQSRLQVKAAGSTNSLVKSEAYPL